MGARVRALACVAVQVLDLRALGFKALGALRAAEGSGGGVGELVSPQLSISEEGFLTGGAGVRPLTCVGSLVTRQTGQLGEASLAEQTLKRLLAAVSQSVSGEDLELTEGLAALGADVRTLPAVDPPVFVQEPHVREAPPTRAGKRPHACVFHVVPPEVRGAAVELLALGAPVLPSHHVALPVPQAIQDAGEALATFLTFVPTVLP